MKKFLVDVDDTLLKYTKAFRQHYRLDFKQRGNSYAEIFDLTVPQIIERVFHFNNSECFKNLQPMENSVEILKEISKEFEVIVITSCGDNHTTTSLREHNLINVYGDIFTDIIYLKHAQPKTKVLEKFKNSGAMWFDDNYDNFKDGLNNKLNSFYYLNKYNANIEDQEIVKSWEDIGKIVLVK